MLVSVFSWMKYNFWGSPPGHRTNSKCRWGPRRHLSRIANDGHRLARLNFLTRFYQVGWIVFVNRHNVSWMLYDHSIARFSGRPFCTQHNAFHKPISPLYPLGLWCRCPNAPCWGHIQHWCCPTAAMQKRGGPPRVFIDSNTSLLLKASGFPCFCSASEISMDFSIFFKPMVYVSCAWTCFSNSSILLVSSTNSVFSFDVSIARNPALYR